MLERRLNLGWHDLKFSMPLPLGSRPEIAENMIQHLATVCMGYMGYDWIKFRQNRTAVNVALGKQVFL